MKPVIFDTNPTDENIVNHSLETTKQGVFWVEDAGEQEKLPVFRGVESCDLAIVGSGFTGMWTAIEAKKRHPDWKIIILEAKTPYWAASGRNGGFMEATLTHGEATGLQHYPDEYGLLEEAGLNNLNEIEATVKEHGWECDYVRSGALSVAVSQHEIEELRESADGENEIFLTGEETRKRVNSPTYLASTFTPHDTAMVHPGKLGKAMMKTVLEMGVQIFGNSKVKTIEKELNLITLNTSRGKLSAMRVALATNVFPSLIKRYSLHTIPVYDYVLMTEPLNKTQMKAIGWEGREGIADLGNQFHYYRITADNRILFGGYDAVYHFGGKIKPEYENRPESHRKLASHFFTTFPQLEGLQFTHKWAGVIDTCSRFHAFFPTAFNGQVAYAAGFTGLGVAATRFAAEVMLDKLERETTWRTELEMVNTLPVPFPPEPFRYPLVQAVKTGLERADNREGKRGIFIRTLDSLGLGFDS